MGSAKCSVCGRNFYVGGLTGELNEAGFGLITKSIKKPICPDCKRAGAFSGGGNGGVNQSASREIEANAKLAEAQAKAVEAQTKAAEKAIFTKRK